MINLNQAVLFGTAFNYLQGEPWTFPENSSELYGSLEFARTTNSSYIEYPGSDDWAVGTGEFTIEFWMFMQQNFVYPRIFSVGTYDDPASIALSIEGGALYFWLNGAYHLQYGLENPFATWNHIAITRDDQSDLRLYVNADKIREEPNITTDITDNVRSLFIGTENPSDQNTQFRGYLTGFRWSKGEALYTGETLTLPTSPLTSTVNTKLLLNSISSGTYLDDASSIERDPDNFGNIQWTNYSPY